MQRKAKLYADFLNVPPEESNPPPKFRTLADGPPPFESDKTVEANRMDSCAAWARHQRRIYRPVEVQYMLFNFFLQVPVTFFLNVFFVPYV